jgi:hypothetical protein
MALPGRHSVGLIPGLVLPDDQNTGNALKLPEML